ncbi:Laccase-12 [Armadillidium vulgare]|nr:Laccase-12 [Armadillidium vulgare]
MPSSHPFHLHGYVFAVLGMEKLGEMTTLQDVKNLDRSGRLMRNFQDPPLKDTVVVPDGGYWLFHCHLLFHLHNGMAAIFHVGEQMDLPPVPYGFPRCGSFVPRPSYNLNSKLRNYEKKSGKPFEWSSFM